MTIGKISLNKKLPPGDDIENPTDAEMEQLQTDLQDYRDKLDNYTESTPSTNVPKTDSEHSRITHINKRKGGRVHIEDEVTKNFEARVLGHVRKDLQDLLHGTKTGASDLKRPVCQKAL